MRDQQHLVVMGVTGCGKSTVAQWLAEQLDWPSAEADEFHPPGNIAKMRAGTPLTDEDRWPWLRTMRDWMTAQAQAGHSTVVTCSALRCAYRDVLREASGRVRFVHLHGTYEEINARLEQRAGHFMPPSLLPSQLAILEPLGPDEDGVVVSVTGTPHEITAEARQLLGL